MRASLIGKVNYSSIAKVWVNAYVSCKNSGLINSTFDVNTLHSEIVRRLDGKSFIYHLCGEAPYYIGQTVNPIARYALHIGDTGCSYSRKGQYQLGLYERGITPMMGLLDICSIDDVNDKEVEWIERYRNCGRKLINMAYNKEDYREYRKTFDSEVRRVQGFKPKLAYKHILLNESLNMLFGNLTPMEQLLAA